MSGSAVAKAINALAGIAAVGALGFFAYRSFMAPQSKVTEPELELESAIRAGVPVQQRLREQDSAEVIARLRAELARKDRQLAQQQLGLAAAQGQQAVEPAENAATEAMRILEARMVADGIDEPAAAQARARLEAILEEVKPRDLHGEVMCASGMCRALLRGSEQVATTSALSAAFERVVERLAKTYSATQTFYDERGEASLYLAKSPELLDTRPPGQPSTPAPPHLVLTASLPPPATSASVGE